MVSRLGGRGIGHVLLTVLVQPAVFSKLNNDRRYSSGTKGINSQLLTKTVYNAIIFYWLWVGMEI